MKAGFKKLFIREQVRFTAETNQDQYKKKFLQLNCFRGLAKTSSFDLDFDVFYDIFKPFNSLLIVGNSP